MTELRDPLVLLAHELVVARRALTPAELARLGYEVNLETALSNAWGASADPGSMLAYASFGIPAWTVVRAAAIAVFEAMAPFHETARDAKARVEAATSREALASLLEELHGGPARPQQMRPTTMNELFPGSLDLFDAATAEPDDLADWLVGCASAVASELSAKTGRADGRAQLAAILRRHLVFPSAVAYLVGLES